MRAYNVGGDSSYSNEANAATLPLPPSVSSNPATDVGDSFATLNGTVNANGSETTAYFEWGATTSYGNTTSSQSVGSGTTDINIFANLTGLSPDTTYHYRAVATNAGGTSYGNDMSFKTLPATTPLILNITYPLEGDTISRPDVMVKGTITNTTGNETGVTVNGMVATVYGNQFVANHVPLVEGSNTITVTAKDIEGNKATASIVVNAITTAPHVTLTANTESGIAPLTAYFSVSTAIPNPVSTYQMDYEGDGTIDYTGSTFENISVTYTKEGIYYPTIKVTDTKGISYSDEAIAKVLKNLP